MALWAIGDFHLSFSTDKSMEIFDPVWKNHEKKIEKYFHKLVKTTDTVVITGDHSWGRKLADCSKDFAFMETLPGRKILLRGNHDMFWDAKKTEKSRLNYTLAKSLGLSVKNPINIYMQKNLRLIPRIFWFFTSFWKVFISLHLWNTRFYTKI